MSLDSATGKPSAGGLLQRYRTIIGQGIWVFAGQAFTGLFTLGGTRLITQYVAPELYGIVNLVQNALVLLRTLFCSPMLNAVLRYYPDAQRGHYLPALCRMLRRTLGQIVIGMELVGILGGLIWSRSTGTGVLIVLTLAVFILFDVYRTLEMTLFNAARRQRPAALLSAGEALLRPLMVVAGVLLFGAKLEVVLGAIGAATGVVLLAMYATTHLEGQGGGDPMPPGISMEMRRYALPLIPIAALNWTTSLSDRYLIQWFAHDLPSVGIYAAGYGLISQPFLILHGVIALTLRPVYFGAVSREDPVHAQRTFRAWLTLSTTICVAATLLIFAFRGTIVGAFLGPKYHGAVVVVPWIALGYCLYVIEQVLEQNLLAHKRTTAVLVAQICGAAASIVVTVPLVALLGMPGAAYACPIYFLIQCIVAAMLVLWSPPRSDRSARPL
jgi:O-antigen/teichoic acid export membrane protein